MFDTFECNQSTGLVVFSEVSNYDKSLFLQLLSIIFIYQMSNKNILMQLYINLKFHQIQHLNTTVKTIKRFWLSTYIL